ncbi:helix-turn-helix transcriptional regulator [Polaribacter pectinis]|uniref:Helix-turn-helix transcriptional regulator n=1 Tax=Polaribacter pectinis TaxID=2738844 RepID=A0A7G9LAS2_9FLAO|nr:helix-turn-helix transcriptional regulator [Polaribacter pectinis]QNM85721.1 helix-turn-helix transcriptional regulator [Polaribacter pectinis]
MKKYTSIGELILDYREYNNLSQSNLATQLNVDLRTIQRWEKNLTLIKSEKEEDIVLATLMPYQLIHNLNAAVPIPTYYNFKTRKYSLFYQNNELPKLSWYKDQIDIVSKNIRTIDFEYDIKHIRNFIDTQKRDDFYVNDDLIKESIKLLPELNYLYTGSAGFYAGHCIVLPLKKSTYLKLKSREISNKDLRPVDLIDYKTEEIPIFYRYDITGDCNETIFYIMGKFFRFFRDLNKKYLMCGYTDRDDNYNLNKEIGLEVVWEDKELQKKLNLDFPPRFFEGNFNNFLLNLKK